MSRSASTNKIGLTGFFTKVQGLIEGKQKVAATALDDIVVPETSILSSCRLFYSF